MTRTRQSWGICVYAWQYIFVLLSFFQNSLSFINFANFVTVGISRFFNGLIGVISMNETNEYIRVGYLSFWGNRCNKYMKLEDVIPLNESSMGIKSKIVRFRQYSSYVNFISKLNILFKSRRFRILEFQKLFISLVPRFIGFGFYQK